MDAVREKCMKTLQNESINPVSSIDFDVNGKVHSLSFEYIIDTYMQASEESRLVFLSALQKAVDAKEMGIEKFFEGMGQLLLMSHLSDKFQ
ncbi:conserved hypothetical protein [Sulfurimonas autotrophica DSM 16294]|uniref:Uncharacterized protein n=2 Tax=Sulfurimonas autotrophica TaxID=202747 RepID=E0UTL1_SULAO|nr:conserved hypothetical protein [Sulfurimonas autotrophica DSM 16294]